MNKFGMVLGVAAVATLAGCKDPDYKYGNEPASQSEVKSAESQPIAIESAPAAKCNCPPGTKHTSPCTCGAPDCKCTVEQPIVITADASKPAAGAVAAGAVAGAAAGAAAGSSEYTTYVVQKGDVLSKIAKKYNLKVADIRNANPKIKKDVIWVGMKIKLPGKVDVGAQQVAAAATKVPVAKKVYAPYTGATKDYVVKSGDTLGAIAINNGLSVRQLKELNGLKKDTIRIGQKLKVPAAKVAAAAAAAKPTAKKAESKPAAKSAEPVKPAEAPKPAEAEKPAEAAPAPEAAPAAAAKPAEAAVPAAEAAPAAAPAQSATYVVQEGDDMTGVSIRWGVSAAAIRELNNLPDDAQLVPGQILKLPADAQQ